MMSKRNFLLSLSALTGIFKFGGKVKASERELVDLKALSNLRPGMSRAALEAALEPKWRAPAPHKGGVVDILEHSHGFVARLDASDKIATIKFDWRFKHQIEGVYIGMPLSQLVDQVPAMKVGDDMELMRGVRYGVMPVEGGRMIVKITLGAVNDIYLSNPDAVLRDKFAPSYPKPAGQPGAPFRDINLKLLVLQDLLIQKRLDLGEYEDLASHVLGRPVDLEEEGYDLIPEVLDYLARYPLSDELIDAVEMLVFDGGNDIYNYAYWFWDGEDGKFDVKDISDISLCRNLKRVEVLSMIETFDFRALVGLNKLEEVRVFVDSSHAEALLDLPSLKVAGTFAALDGNAAVVQTLKSRGVEIIWR